MSATHPADYGKGASKRDLETAIADLDRRCEVQQIFDLVIIGEASQVLVAQALPALLRAKKVVAFGDAKHFSNVRAAQASNAINAKPPRRHPGASPTRLRGMGVSK